MSKKTEAAAPAPVSNRQTIEIAVGPNPDGLRHAGIAAQKPDTPTPAPVVAEEN